MLDLSHIEQKFVKAVDAVGDAFVNAFDNFMTNLVDKTKDLAASAGRAVNAAKANVSSFVDKVSPTMTPVNERAHKQPQVEINGPAKIKAMAGPGMDAQLNDPGIQQTMSNLRMMPSNAMVISSAVSQSPEMDVYQRPATMGMGQVQTKGQGLGLAA